MNNPNGPFQGFEDAWTVRFDTPDKMHQHLLDHRQAGHRVPQRALDALAAEADGAEVAAG